MINRQKNTYIVLSIIFLVFSIVFSVNAYIEYTKYQDMDLKVNVKKSELAAIVESANYLKAISVNSEKITNNLSLLANRIGKSIDFAVLVNDIRTIANSLGQIQSLEPSEVIDKGDYKEMKVTLSITTDFDSLRRLVYTVKYPDNKYSRCFRLDSFKYTMNASGHVVATLDLVAFTVS